MNLFAERSDLWEPIDVELHRAHGVRVHGRHERGGDDLQHARRQQPGGHEDDPKRLHLWCASRETDVEWNRRKAFGDAGQRVEDLAVVRGVGDRQNAEVGRESALMKFGEKSFGSGSAGGRGEQPNVSIGDLAVIE